MSTVETVSVSVIAAIRWAKDHDAFSLLETLFPHLDHESLKRIWSDPDMLDDTATEVDVPSRD